MHGVKKQNNTQNLWYTVIIVHYIPLHWKQFITIIFVYIFFSGLFFLFKVLYISSRNLSRNVICAVLWPVNIWVFSVQSEVQRFDEWIFVPLGMHMAKSWRDEQAAVTSWRWLVGVACCRNNSGKKKSPHKSSGG